MSGSEADHSIFHLHTPSRLYIYLVIYFGNIIITDEYFDGILRLRSHLHGQFECKGTLSFLCRNMP